MQLRSALVFLLCTPLLASCTASDNNKGGDGGDERVPADGGDSDENPGDTCVDSPTAPIATRCNFVYCTELALKYAGCGFGELPYHAKLACEEPYGAGKKCVARCILGLSCSDLAQRICSSAAADLQDSTCAMSCSSSFTCGSGEQIPQLYVCNGRPQCLDGSDEPSTCTKFACGGGQEISPSLECDGIEQCDNGADEHAGCPAGISFICANGEHIPIGYECDGEAYCADETDEHAGCPTFTCSDSTVLPKIWECDQQPDCSDESDEHANCWYNVVCGAR